MAIHLYTISSTVHICIQTLAKVLDVLKKIKPEQQQQLFQSPIHREIGNPGLLYSDML